MPVKIVESRQNPIFKQALKITQQSRNFPQHIVVEGEKLIGEALAAGLTPIYFFITSKSSMHLPQLGSVTIELAEKLFRELSTVTSPADGIAIFSAPANLPLLKFLETASMLVILDRLQDPGNVGTIVRTAEAMGADATILLSGSCCANNPKVIRAGMGSTFRLPIYEKIDCEELFRLLKEHGFTSVCADMNGQSIFSCQLPSRLALFLGQEGSGLAEKIVKDCTMKLAIPMHGEVESLNVATSAAICLYEWSKQQHK